MLAAALSPQEALLAELERLIRRDPARRGLIESEQARGPLCPGHLAAAVDHLARFGREVWLLTGFFIPRGTPPAAETDGPPGTACLAAVLRDCGIAVRIITDEPCAAACRAAAELYGLEADVVSSLGLGASVAEWAEVQVGQSATLSHVIAIERVGPSPIASGLARPQPASQRLGERFAARVPLADQGRCHNMRGEVIDAQTAPLHEILEAVHRLRSGVRTIGVGDGGNELGLGAVPWEELAARLTGPAAALVPCRIATDWTILAGVSNWGAQALAAGVAFLRGRTAWIAEADRALEERRLGRLVQDGPAVDGVTRLQEATVDGLPFLTYIQPWEGMRRLVLGPEP